MSKVPNLTISTVTFTQSSLQNLRTSRKEAQLALNIMQVAMAHMVEHLDFCSTVPDAHDEGVFGEYSVNDTQKLAAVLAESIQKASIAMTLDPIHETGGTSNIYQGSL